MSVESASARPSVTVIVAVHNAELYIAETLDSIRSQTFRDFEVIVVDDGSTDRTPQVVARYPEVRYIRQSNQGQPVARNVGIKAALGTYVAFLDADDLWLPDKLAKQIGYLLKHPEAVWIYTDAVVFDSVKSTTIARIGEKHKLCDGMILRQLLLDAFISSPTPVIRRSIFEDLGMFEENPSLRFGEDWNMWLRVAEKYPVAVIPDVLALIRVHGANMTGSADPLAVFASKRDIADSAISRAPDQLTDLRGRAVSLLAHSAGLRCLRLGRGSDARAMFLEAIRNWPGSFTSYAYLVIALLPAQFLTRLGGAWRSLFTSRAAHTELVAIRKGGAQA
jgi:GT2 family glycosyltransferase